MKSRDIRKTTRSYNVPGGPRRFWGLSTPRGLPVLFSSLADARENRDVDERVALYEVRQYFREPKRPRRKPRQR